MDELWVIFYTVYGIQCPIEMSFIAIYPTNLDFGKERFPVVPEIFKPKIHGNCENALTPECLDGCKMTQYKDFPGFLGGSDIIM